MGLRAPAIPVVIVTRDRRERLLSTLARLAALPRAPARRRGRQRLARRHGRGRACAASRRRGPRPRSRSWRGGAQRRRCARSMRPTWPCATTTRGGRRARWRARRAPWTRAARRRARGAACSSATRSALDPTCALMAAQPAAVADRGLPGPRVLGFVACGAVVRREAVLAVGGFDRPLRHRRRGEPASRSTSRAAGWWLAYAPGRGRPSPSSRRRTSGAVAPGADGPNDLWTTWLHRSPPTAARRSAAILAGAGATAPLPLAAALRGAPRVLRGRRALAPRSSASCAWSSARRATGQVQRSGGS